MLTFFGFMHGEAIGIAVTPVVAIAYLIVAVFLFGLSRAPASALDRTAPHEALPEPAERAMKLLAFAGKQTARIAVVQSGLLFY